MFEIKFSMYGARLNKHQIYAAATGSIEGIEHCPLSLKDIVEGLNIPLPYSYYLDEEGDEVYIGRNWNTIGTTWWYGSEDKETRNDFIKSTIKDLRSMFGKDIFIDDFSYTGSN